MGLLEGKSLLITGVLLAAYAAFFARTTEEPPLPAQAE